MKDYDFKLDIIMVGVWLLVGHEIIGPLLP
jgi:hypothetical protein